MSMQISLAKITKPRSSEIYKRERLFRLLDQSRKQPLVWVSGPAGSGKTTLVSSYLDSRKLPGLWYMLDEGDSDPATFFYYLGIAATKMSAPNKNLFPLLTPEYIQGISIFAKRFFERLCEGLRLPFALVFDNYQDVPESSLFHEMIIHGLDMIPDGITVIIVSRKEPPPPFSRFRANNKMDFIGWDQIRFNLQEAREIVCTYKKSSLTDESVDELYRKTQGWMAGLVLLMEGAKRTGMDQTMLCGLVPEAIFDYFESEIFKEMDTITQEFLLKTSLLPSMTATLAQKLAGIQTAERILSCLYKNNYFIEMRAQDDSVYHYHPLFREFLLAKAKNVYTPAEMSLTMRKVAVLLEESGQMEDAALLLRDTKDWECFVALVLKHADPLFKQGRGKTLLDWIDSIPKIIVENNLWLLYWIGVCKMPYSLTESRSYLEKSFDAFLSDAREAVFRIKSHTIVYLTLISEAEYFLKRNEEKAGLDALAKAMSIGRKQGFVNNSAWRHPVMSFLCAKALEAEIEVEHVQELIRKRNLIPDTAFVELESWPWPVRIHALGQFKIELDGKPLTFTGKVQKKPLELLKTLISFGCRGVNETKIMDALWPDAEGDSAYRSFVSALQRLRKLLGRKEAVQLQDGSLSLDPRYCWLDCRAFEHLIKKADDIWKTGKERDAIRLYERALDLYGGPLMGQEFGKYGDASLCGSLNEKFVRCLKVLGQHAEQLGELEKAITYYIRGLDVDGRTEEIYRLLMACQAKAGRYSEVINIHDRCRKMLNTNYGREPSTETVKIYQTARKNIIPITSRENTFRNRRITD